MQDPPAGSSGRGEVDRTVPCRHTDEAGSAERVPVALRGVTGRRTMRSENSRVEPAHEAVVDIRTLADKTGLETQEIIDLLRIFRDTTLADLGQMGQRLCLEDFPEVSRCAHSIRGAALNLSLRYLAEAAEVVEDCA